MFGTCTINILSSYVWAFLLNKPEKVIIESIIYVMLSQLTTVVIMFSIHFIKKKKIFQIVYQ